MINLKVDIRLEQYYEQWNVKKIAISPFIAYIDLKRLDITLFLTEDEVVPAAGDLLVPRQVRR